MDEEQERHIEYQLINRDEVSYIMHALKRYEEVVLFSKNKGVSKIRQFARVSCLMEIMEILRYQFEDRDSVFNVFADFSSIQQYLDGSIEIKRINVEKK